MKKITPSLLTALLSALLLFNITCKKDDNQSNQPDPGFCPGLETVTWQGQTYNTVLIGDQCWFKENLNYESGNSWCYNNDPVNCETYGRLYDWETALGVCPSGWKLPSDEEWKILEGTVDSQYGYPNEVWDGEGNRGFDACLNLKSTSGWNNNGNGTDLYGFSALPGGFRSSGGYFDLTGSYGYWWSSDEYPADGAWIRELSYDYGWSGRFFGSKYYGFSVRCLRD
nr:fibrobacter succinogenes major paralogous domain-containing protein [Bacteroidota bacterium]